MIEGEVEVLEIDARPQQRGDRFVAHTGFDPRAPATPYRCRDRADEGESAVLLEAGRIEPGAADGDRKGGPAQPMETR